MRQTASIYSIFNQFVTVEKRYTVRMNTISCLIFSLSNLLISYAALGCWWLVLLFLVCFFGVHVTRLAKLGWEYQKQNAKPVQPPSPPEKTAPEKQENGEKKAPAQETTAQEPIYYIVERKQRRAKASYGEPKQIRFK